MGMLLALSTFVLILRVWLWLDVIVVNPRQRPRREAACENLGMLWERTSSAWPEDLHAVCLILVHGFIAICDSTCTRSRSTCLTLYYHAAAAEEPEEGSAPEDQHIRPGGQEAARQEEQRAVLVEEHPNPLSQASTAYR